MLIDGLQCGHFTRDTFSHLRQADVGAVTVTCGFWEGTVESLDSIARWRDLVNANKDLVAIATSAAEIEAIAKSGRTAIILGFQNSNLFEGRIRFVEFFAELGVRAIQLTYNNQNELGGSCYEDEDSGLSRTGKEMVREMNRVGILVDLSHVGNRTTKDAIICSEKPVAVTHANPDSLFPHKRNKTDDVLKVLAEKGGVLGCACTTATSLATTIAAPSRTGARWSPSRSTSLASTTSPSALTAATTSPSPTTTGCAWAVGRAESTTAQRRPPGLARRRHPPGSRKCAISACW